MYTRRGGGHSPWFWVPTAKRTPGAVAVGPKKGGCHRPKNSQEGAVRGAFPVGAVVVSLASPRKASWISVLATVIKVIVSGLLKMMSTGGKPQ